MNMRRRFISVINSRYDIVFAEVVPYPFYASFLPLFKINFALLSGKCHHNFERLDAPLFGLDILLGELVLVSVNIILTFQFDQLFIQIRFCGIRIVGLFFAEIVCSRSCHFAGRFQLGKFYDCIIRFVFKHTITPSLV